MAQGHLAIQATLGRHRHAFIGLAAVRGVLNMQRRLGLDARVHLEVVGGSDARLRPTLRARDGTGGSRRAGGGAGGDDSACMLMHVDDMLIAYPDCVS